MPGPFRPPRPARCAPTAGRIGRALAAYPGPAPVRLPRERAKKPYTAEEISAYLGLADAQPTVARAMRAAAAHLPGGRGGPGGRRAQRRAGPRRGRSLGRGGGRCQRTPPPGRARALPLRGPPGELRRLRRDGLPGRGDGALPAQRGLGLGGARCAGGTDLPRLEQARLRATWLAELAGAIGLGAFMAATGVDCSQRLGDIAAGLPALAEAETVALLGGAS